MTDNSQNTDPKDAPELVLEQFLTTERRERLHNVLNQRTDSLTVVLDRVHNYHNISAVIRSADAFGLSELHLVGSSFEYSPDISLGTERWLNLKKHSSPEEALSNLKQSGFELVLTQPEQKSRENSRLESIPVFDLPFGKPLALVFGNELEGISSEFVSKARYSAYIPMYGFVDSLNISVACAIALFCSTISNAKGDRRVQLLDHRTRDAIWKNWLRKDVRGAESILKEVELRRQR